MTKLDWAEKYRPERLRDIVGHASSIEKIKSWAFEWNKRIPEKRAIIIYGKPGTGKTTTAHALAKEMEWEVIELNASDQRNADIINKIVGSASQNSTLYRKKRLIIMDEADNIYGTADRGGERAIQKLINKTNQPIILIANELNKISKSLVALCEKIQFSSIRTSSIVSVLIKISKLENIEYDMGMIEKIALNSNGDLRSAINDMQATSDGYRDKKQDVFKVLSKIFNGKDIKESYYSTFSIDENPQDLIQWIDEALPYQYSIYDLLQGYKILSKASLFLGRVNIRQNYGMWRYASFLMSSGITASKTIEHRSYMRFQYPSLWRKYSQTKGMRAIRDKTAKKIAKHCHVSTSYARVNLFPFFEFLMSDREYAVKISALLNLEQDEISFLTKKKNIKKIYDESQSLIKEKIEQDIKIFGGFEKKENEEKPQNEPEKKPNKKQKSLFDFA